MKQFFRRSVSVLLAAALLASLTLPAAASFALGEDLAQKETVLHEETALSHNVFWSTTYSDLRQEHYITYTPNEHVTPIVTSGSVLSERSTVSAAAKKLEEAGYRVVAGVNGDFYNTTSGQPIGMVVTEGLLRTSGAGYYAIGFRQDGTAVIGKPDLEITATFGGDRPDEFGVFFVTELPIAGINRTRSSTSGVYLYTHDFNVRHTTGTTEPGVDVLCSVTEGELTIGGELLLTVDQVLDGVSATSVPEDKVVLTVNLKAGEGDIAALRSLSAGDEIRLNISAADEAWNEVEYAIGALYSLVENGVVTDNQEAGANPRTAVGQRPDGTLIFYTIDGRKSGHSIGATLDQVAERLIELGCDTAVCLDGGGSTTLSVTRPDALTVSTVNRPSDGNERAVTNQIFLVADAEPSGQVSHFYVNAEQDYVLAGSKVNITASAVDTNYIPVSVTYQLSTTDGILEGNVLTTPAYGGDVVVTASRGGDRGSTTVHVVETPDSVSLHAPDGDKLTELTVTPGSTTRLTAAAKYQHLALKADAESFVWVLEGDIGTLGADGTFYAERAGEGHITVSAGGTETTIPVTVTRLPLKTVEHFEEETTLFTAGSGFGMQWSTAAAGDYVRMGRSSGRLDYTLSPEEGLVSQWRLVTPAAMESAAYTGLNLWLYGDESGNDLVLLYNDESGQEQEIPLAHLDFAGWKQISVDMGAAFSIVGLKVKAPEPQVSFDGLGTIIMEYADTPHSGTLYLDQIVASFGEAVDSVAPEVALTVEGTGLTASAMDQVDGAPAVSAIRVTYDGKALEFAYDAKTGIVTAALPEADGLSHRVTVTAADASGNVGRASYDVPTGEDYVPVFTDTEGYWAANFIDFLYTSGITTGYEDGTFRPGQNISRAQFAVMLYRYLGLEEEAYAEAALPFADLEKIPAYALPAIRALYTEGIINGSTGADGALYFNPNNSLTRAQGATMIGRTQEKGYATVELTFTDAEKIPAYAQYYIQTMAAQGVLGGYADGSFKPNNAITRGQMAKILYNLM